MKKILMLTAAVMALQALPALAGEDGGHKGGKRGMGIFEVQDADKDGFVTKEEFLKFSTDRFTESDANGDGKVSKDEVKAHHETMKKKWEAKKKEMEAGKAKEGSAPAEAPAKAAE